MTVFGMHYSAFAFSLGGDSSPMGPHILWMVTVSGWTTKHINIFHANFYKFEYILDLFLFSVPKYKFKNRHPAFTAVTFFYKIYFKNLFTIIYQHYVNLLIFSGVQPTFLCAFGLTTQMYKPISFLTPTHHNC